MSGMAMTVAMHDNTDVLLNTGLLCRVAISLTHPACSGSGVMAIHIL
jgi:hypothetical protein